MPAPYSAGLPPSRNKKGPLIFSTWTRPSWIASTDWRSPRSCAPPSQDRQGGGRWRISSQRYLLAAVPHGVLPRGPVALIAPSLIVGLGSAGRIDAPGNSERRARLCKVCLGAAALFARPAAWIEPA